ncbi:MULTISPECIES: beta-mannosidase [Rhodococcus]|uniref:Beta-mannosidase n=1 Tax=Rhodococcus cercidiphylli TaxID=489916 RepID=A0ABU4B241_9NOCA|nr:MULTISPECIES: beta-mannosidase [Rhodococcus]MDV6232546.1 beta-mannosidase [Rhodococcus cercidiphylli]MDV8054803.1 beta-mannosidase [Rhodococcus sp. IEGM 1343]
MRIVSMFSRCAVGAAIVLSLALSTGVPDAAAAPGSGARVTASADGLALDGNPWWPTGFNAYQLATDWSANAGCGAMVDLNGYFGALPPHSLTRFNAFQALAINRFTGALDFRPMDAVFAAAEAHGQLVVPVLSPQDGACEGNVFKGRQWYIDGWTTPPAVADTNAVTSFEQWMLTAVNRWKDSPALAAWELVGEPETSSCTDAACSWTTRTCTADAAQVLRSFFDTAGQQLRTVDPRTLITAGLTGGGQCGSQGDEYEYLAQSSFVDVLQYHDYGFDGVPLPGDQWNGLQRRITQSAAVGKPLLVGEIGQLAGSCGDIGSRATSIATKIDGQRAAGTAGALLWAFVPDPRPGECTYDIGPGDPLWQTIGR